MRISPRSVGILLTQKSTWARCSHYSIIALLFITSFTYGADKIDVVDIIAKSAEAAGGKEKLEALKTVELSGTVEMAAQGVSGTFLIKKKPDRAKMSIELKNLGMINYGWLKDVVYEESDLTGTRLVTGPERDQLLRDLDMKQAFTRLENLKNVRIDGEEEIRGQKTWRVIGDTATGTPETNWIDQKTFLPARMKMTVQTQMGELVAVVDFKDYKSFDGIPMPMTTEQAAGPMVMVLTMNDVKLNPELADDEFKLPAEVQELINTATTQPTTKP